MAVTSAELFGTATGGKADLTDVGSGCFAPSGDGRAAETVAAAVFACGATPALPGEPG
jgi:hypothetical protein